MIEIVRKSIAENGLKNAYVRLIVTRGVGDLGLDPRKCPKPSIIAIAQDFAPLYGDLYEKGISVVSVATRRIASDALDIKAKTLNYLNNIMAKVQANLAGCDEALMMNSHGFVSEGTGDNMFIVKNGVVYTPPSSAGVLLGITRKTIFELCEGFGIEISERDLTPFDVYTADESFMTGTAAEIIPIVKVDDRTIGDGKPGSVTKRLIEGFKELRENDGVKVY